MDNMCQSVNFPITYLMATDGFVHACSLHNQFKNLKIINVQTKKIVNMKNNNLPWFGPHPEWS